MTPHRILYLDALSTVACAIGMLAARGILYPLFGLDNPLLFDALAVGMVIYAGAVAAAARRDTIDRSTLRVFAIANGLWVVGSAIVLVLFWHQMAPIARALLIAVALVVEVFATLQYRAAGSMNPRALRTA